MYESTPKTKFLKICVNLKVVCHWYCAS